MNYAGLYDFVRHRMRMSHVYQPVMLMTMLRGCGECHAEEIARVILSHDRGYARPPLGILAGGGLAPLSRPAVD